MNKPDYSTYSMEELLDCQEMIDKEAWPERYQEILATIEPKVSASPSQAAVNKRIRFENFCYELSRELCWSLSDEFSSIASLFSEHYRNKLPNVTFPLN
ncbi:hypothetical protein [Shewanella salipaludis]|uniref:Uncharacterized protein n=1 Tax=Shewanella salipaludis TaxID=2723052 RepID=A0A972FV06_9GAMM|nr:hypothetical protein [Shewanella salipaludis]NMH66625.1 hypothetical protein [Shewanella salipaludis]